MCYASYHKVESMAIDCWRPFPLFNNPSLGCSLRILKLKRGWLGGKIDLLTFQNLHTIHIYDTWVQAPLESLIDNCPSLEELFLKSSSFVSLRTHSNKMSKLSIHDCSSHDEKIEISCPSLISLSYGNTPSMKCSLENLWSLDNAYFSWFDHKGVKFLNGLCRVKVLVLDCLHLESIYKEALNGSLPVFHNLKSLTTKSCPVSTKIHAQAITYLLLNSPALETLIIEHSTYYLGKCNLSNTKGGGWPPKGFDVECFSCLKVVEFRKFGSSTAEIELLKFISQNARDLERITIAPNKKVNK
ncbi:uncharacterized protein A4U43_C08F25480 [Asparagus officinalis]|nr:uncharacterized protein A4U43_C08F25480 [Asparagus officinalis]